MSLFGNLVRTDGTTKSELDFRELPIWSIKRKLELAHLRLFSRRSFADKSKVVVKKLISADEETKKSLIKEARLLQNLRYANVVEFKGICTDQLSLLLEYAYFDFSPFGCDIQTHSLAEFLAVCKQSTQQKTHNLFWPDENSIQQCCAAHIVQGCQQYCSTLLHLIVG